MEKTYNTSINKDNQNKMNTVEEPPATAATIQFLQGSKRENKFPATPIHLWLPNSKNQTLFIIRVKLQQSKSPQGRNFTYYSGKILIHSNYFEIMYISKDWKNKFLT